MAKAIDYELMAEYLHFALRLMQESDWTIVGVVQAPRLYRARLWAYLREARN
jgi:hypothetical protein